MYRTIILPVVLEVISAVRLLQGSLGFKGLMFVRA